MRALITGGNGFVGRHLQAHLESLGDSVSILDLPLDITDYQAVRDVVADVQPDAIYHLAALSHVGTSWTNPSAVVDVNVAGTTNVLSAAREVVPNATVLFVSSADVYGPRTPQEMPLGESTEPRPTSPYAASKLAGEVFAQQAVRGFGQRVVIARPFNHVGPGQNASFFIPGITSRMVAATENAATDIAVGNLTSRRDFTDVRDVVRAYRLLVERGVAGEVYVIASGRDVMMQDVADELRQLVNPALRFVEDPALLRPVDVPLLRGDASKLEAATGWRPEISWSETLADIVADVTNAPATN
jgi:GDP-4-dehydro-6-deoxy-D-mannose reductase